MTQETIDSATHLSRSLRQAFIKTFTHLRHPSPVLHSTCCLIYPSRQDSSKSPTARSLRPFAFDTTRQMQQCVETSGAFCARSGPAESFVLYGQALQREGVKRTATRVVVGHSTRRRLLDAPEETEAARCQPSAKGDVHEWDSYGSGAMIHSPRGKAFFAASIG